MENPATWGKAEHVVNEALEAAQRLYEAELIGLSKVRLITDALREADLLVEESET